MATPNINPFNRYIGNGAATQFSVGFPYIKKEFVHVYIRRIDGAQEEMTAPDWEWVNDTEIRFPAVGSSETVLATGEILVVQRETPTESDYLFTNQKRLFPEDVMDADDLEMHILQEQKYELDRSIKVSQTSDVDPDTIIPKVEAIYDNLGIIETVGADLPNINTVANHATDISTVAGIASDVSSLSGIASDISAVANNATNIDAVADNESNINTCATNIASIIDAPNQASAAAASAQQAAISAAGTHFKLFQHNWFDYQLNDMAWLCADTFSWQDGTVYSDAYDHLEDDIDGITASTETIGGYTVTYYLATDGHKIVLPDQETTISNIFTATGIAWYYVLDTVNKRFKLPRTKFAFVGLRDTVGKYVAPGLPNITGQINPGGGNTGNPFGGATTAEGAFERVDDGIQKTMGLSNDNYTCYNISLDASRSNPIYGASDTVQQPATQQHLYFYVGQYTQSATEQTAGLNAELFNGKMDINALNINAAGKSTLSVLSFPSNTYDELTLGATETSYQAPANGWFVLGKKAGASNKHIQLANKVVTQVHSIDSDSKLFVYLPCKKGDSVTVTYNATGDTIFFRFYYAQGEVNV